MMSLSGLIWGAGAAVAQEGKKSLPNMEQTERWLIAHLEAWDDVNQPEVSVSKCIIQLTTANKSYVLNMKGLLWPVELLSLDNRDTATVRARVREPKSGKFAMSRLCSESNRWCKINDGKFVPERFVEFQITFYRPYHHGDQRLPTTRKALQLIGALNHYARLCSSSHINEEERIWFDTPER